MLPGKLLAGLQSAGVPNAPKLAQTIFKSPLSFVKENPPGTPAREAVVNAYRDVQRVLTIVGVCIAAVLIPLAFLMDNVQLEDRKNLVDSDSDSNSEMSIPRPDSRDEKRSNDKNALNDTSDINQLPTRSTDTRA